MGYKTFACMNVAVIGDGGIAETIARKLATASYNVFIGTKSEHALLSSQLFKEFTNTVPATIEYAAAVADIIIIATTQDEVREAAYLLDDVRNKIIIDMSGFHFTRFGNYLNTANAISAITFSPYVVKCYCTGGFEGLVNLFSSENNDIMYYAGDSKKAKEMLKLIARDMGFSIFRDFGYSEDIPDLDKYALTGHFLVPQKR